MIHVQGSQFKDEHGRTLLLRGVNLGGSSKVPLNPNGATYKRAGFLDPRKVSFVGRPFPLEEAGEHFSRLREWSLTLLRFLVTWETITLFTLFFGGNDFAPNTRIEGEPAQDYLQRHYLDAIKQVAARLKGLPNVIGYDTMNEPLAGFIGWHDLNVAGGTLKLGPSPSPFQAMLLGAGYPQEVDVWDQRVTGPKKIGRRVVNLNRLRAWRAGFDCVWRQNGVWDAPAGGAPRLLRPDHFRLVGRRQVDFTQDYYYPFAKRYAHEIRSVAPDAAIFIETETSRPPPQWKTEDATNIVYAPHWYDGTVLFLKHYNHQCQLDDLSHLPWRAVPGLRGALFAPKQSPSCKIGIASLRSQ